MVFYPKPIAGLGWARTQLRARQADAGAGDIALFSESCLIRPAVVAAGAIRNG